MTLAGSVTAEPGTTIVAVVCAEAAGDGEHRSAYREGAHCGVAVSVVVSAGAVGDVGMALWGAATEPFRARQTEAALRGRRVAATLVADAVATLRGEVQPGGRGQLVDQHAIDEIARVAESALDSALQADTRDRP